MARERFGDVDRMTVQLVAHDRAQQRRAQPPLASGVMSCSMQCASWSQGHSSERLRLS
jgi:hypothetical protein